MYIICLHNYHRDDDSMYRYLETCGKINAFVTDCDVAEIIVILRRISSIIHCATNLTN